jgi:hypothetical protein
MSDVKYTKKASARIIKEVQKINPKASLTTTFDQAFVLLMTEWDLEVGLEKNENTIYSSIYKDGNTVHAFEWKLSEAWSEKEMDFNWDFVYRTVLEHIIKTRLYKRPKVGKRELARIAKEKAEAEKLAAKEAAKAEKERIAKEKAEAKAAKEAIRLAKAQAKENKTKLTRKNKAR